MNNKILGLTTLLLGACGTNPIHIDTKDTSSYVDTYSVDTKDDSEDTNDHSDILDSYTLDIKDSFEACTKKTWYQDLDGDGFGGIIIKEACEKPVGYVSKSGDCKDNNAAINPAVEEICNEDVDDDCDPETKEECPVEPQCTVLEDFLEDAKGCTDLADYHQCYVKNSKLNAKIVVGKDSQASELLAAIDVATSLTSKGIAVPGAVLDSEVSDICASNLISFGNACVNSVTAQLQGNPEDCLNGLEPGKALIKLYQTSEGYTSMIIAGFSGDETRAAGKIIANGGNIFGTTMEVNTTSLGTSLCQSINQNQVQSSMFKDNNYEVFLQYVDAESAKLFINGEATPRMKINDYFKLNNGVSIELNEVIHQAFADGVHIATFCLTDKPDGNEIFNIPCWGNIDDLLYKGEQKSYPWFEGGYDVGIVEINQANGSVKFKVNGEILPYVGKDALKFNAGKKIALTGLGVENAEGLIVGSGFCIFEEYLCGLEDNLKPEEDQSYYIGSKIVDVKLLSIQNGKANFEINDYVTGPVSKNNSFGTFGTYHGIIKEVYDQGDYTGALKSVTFCLSEDK
tara:strand:+ start:92654 stop:94360 length:1707 start_codon:yes stop_codon:yes gene_type:complete